MSLGGSQRIISQGSKHWKLVCGWILDMDPAHRCLSQRGMRGKLAASPKLMGQVALACVWGDGWRWFSPVLKGVAPAGQENTPTDVSVSVGLAFLPKADPLAFFFPCGCLQANCSVGTQVPSPKPHWKTTTITKAYDLNRETQEDSQRESVGREAPKKKVHWPRQAELPQGTGLCGFFMENDSSTSLPQSDQA